MYCRETLHGIPYQYIQYSETLKNAIWTFQNVFGFVKKQCGSL